MKINKGDKLTVEPLLKQSYHAIALDDFDIEADEWFPLAVDQDEVRGLKKVWKRGDKIPCRRGQATITKRDA